jgi:NitT/TauT family transport system ATP-binding protein
MTGTASAAQAPIGAAAAPALRRDAAPIIAFDHVGLTLGSEAIYDQLSFDVRPGEFLCILGPSGCGKSTSLRLIGGLLPAGGGTITVDGRPPAEAWSDIAFVFQSPRLVPWRSALGNVMLGGDLRFGGAGRAERRVRAQALLELVGLSRDAGKYPIMLSGGERQRVAIARALAVDPKIVLMDEPFSALDPNTRARMRTEVERIWQTTGKTVVLVTHDIDEALALADRIVLLSNKPTRMLEIITPPAPRPRNLADPALATLRARLLSLFRSLEPAEKGDPR